MEIYSMLSPGLAWICRLKSPLEFRSQSSDGMMIKHHKTIVADICSLFRVSGCFTAIQIHLQP